MSRFPAVSAVVCPVCGGTGKARSEFYPDLPKPVGETISVFVDCRTCVGKGIVFITGARSAGHTDADEFAAFQREDAIQKVALETPYLQAGILVPPVSTNPAWRESLRHMIENARSAVEAMKDGRTEDYMLSAVAMIAFFDGLEEALRATAADADWKDLPEYSTSLPTWMMGDDGGLIGVKKWKRHWQRPGEDYWMIGEAFSFKQSKRVNILWSRVRS